MLRSLVGSEMCIRDRERKDVPPLPTILPRKNIPVIQRLLWGTLPIGSLLFAILLNGSVWFSRQEDRETLHINTPEYPSSKISYRIYSIWIIFLLALTVFTIYNFNKNNQPHNNPLDLLYSYYHAIDFKYTEEAYGYLDSAELSYEQYTLEQSLEDGILASYAKLDTIEIKEARTISQNKKEISLTAHWFTAVQKYKTDHKHLLVKKNNKWYIKRESNAKSTPPDQLINIPDINFYDQGRRKADIVTSRDDVLDRPEIYISEANFCLLYTSPSPRDS